MIVKDIKSWIRKNFPTVTDERVRRIKNILSRYGWDFEAYRPSMKEDLHKWLTAWYTLSVKRLPKPATQKR